VTDVLEETAGAVNKPADVIDPALADQLTCELEVLLTVGGELLLAPPVQSCGSRTLTTTGTGG
jgi:hypothetical protein